MAITLLPTPPSRQDPANFNVRADEFLGALPTFGTEANALATDVNAKQSTASTAATTATTKASEASTSATNAEASATTATTKAGEAATSASNASGSATTATTKAGEAATSATNAAASATTATTKASEASASATNAAASATQAEIFATQQLTATSTTSLTPSTGSKSLTVQTSKSFVIGMYLVITSSSDNTQKMSGYVTSYTSGTGALVVNVDFSTGSTAKTDWVIGVAAAGGANLTSLNQGSYAAVSTSGGTLVSNKRYGVWTGSTAITMTLPSFANSIPGDEIILGNVDSTWGTNNLTINAPANVLLKNPAGTTDTSLVCNTYRVQVVRLYCCWKDGTNAYWAIG